MPGITGEFREIVEAHQSRVYSIAYRVLGDRGTAEEVAQDVFLELYRAWASIASCRLQPHWQPRQQLKLIERLWLGHPGGTLLVTARFAAKGSVSEATVFGTARRITEGQVFWKGV